MAIQQQNDDLDAATNAVAADDGKTRELELNPTAFWDCAADLDEVTIRILPPPAPLAILERLGPSPFPRGGFPLIGFLATTYEKVSRYALEGM